MRKGDKDFTKILSFHYRNLCIILKRIKFMQYRAAPSQIVDIYVSTEDDICSRKYKHGLQPRFNEKEGEMLICSIKGWELPLGDIEVYDYLKERNRLILKDILNLQQDLNDFSNQSVSLGHILKITNSEKYEKMKMQLFDDYMKSYDPELIINKKIVELELKKMRGVF